MIVSGKDGKIIKRKGDPIFIAQNMAYLYNDKDQKTEIKDDAFSQSLEDVPEQVSATPSSHVVKNFTLEDEDMSKSEPNIEISI